MQGQALGLHLTRAAVLGRPIGHSLSPALHQAAYAALGLDGWTYEAIDCGADDLADLVDRSGPEWAGFSVTMPGKHVALAFAAHRTPVADLVGAANTLLPGRQGWIAANTDVDGIIRALEPHVRVVDGVAVEGVAVDGVAHGAPFVLLGAGGTAQAALVAARRMGITAVHAVVRDPTRAARLEATAQRVAISLTVHTFGSVSSEALLSSGCVLVSTLPPRAADALAERDWPAATVVLDAVYEGWPTALARAVTEADGTAISGVEILLHQAAEQVRLMTGRDAPLDAMRAALPL